MVQDFKTFLNRGNVVQIAVGLVIALYFQKIVEAFVSAIIDPLISIIFGKAALGEVGFSAGGAFFPIGLILNAVVLFIFVAFLLFVIVRAYERGRTEEAAPTEVDLLTEIRDSLRNR